ncbi:hypothetical protein QAD02_015054 [Eretmocerus hayati]|uniref:Uncharacterized protein n=1 Tax=Eretmocerus hayati TaxID=131215 RepID=A0ACC2P7L1_9HYME|nr:hypothetical protein QAD02_015054 [Eretmocerus hayati]
MSGTHQKLPRVSVKDSFDEDDLSDVDDEVFIRDGKSGIIKIDDDCGVKRPLMAPRKKHKTHFAETSSKVPYRTLFAPICYILVAFLLLIGFIVISIMVMSRLPFSMKIFKGWIPQDDKIIPKKQNAVPCTSLNSKIQWIKSFPKITAEAPLRSIDVDGDHIDDIIVGFSTGLDKPDTPPYVCTLYLNQNAPCLGGVLALDGKTGDTIWTHWTAHAVFSIDCSIDLTNDSIKDCIASGRGGILHVINGRNGTSLWELPSKDPTMLPQQKYYDTYDGRYMVDIDDDGISDIIASHTWQSQKSESEVLLISGKTGTIINSMDFPKTEQLFVAPQMIVHPDGESYFIIVSSDQQKTGGLYIISYPQLLKGEFELQQLYHGAGKGILLPPLLVDINSDGTEDLIVTMFNSTIAAYDGLTFQEIWNFTVPGSEIISIPIPGYYNDDNVPDFMVKNQVGPGFPIYYYSTATILDGKNGKPLLEKPMEDTMSAQMSGLSVTVDGYGNDWFLHWSANCLGKEGAKDEFKFVKEPNLDADLCMLRFNSTLTTSLLAFSQHVEPPGSSLYLSEDWKKVEFNNSLDSSRKIDTSNNMESNYGGNGGDGIVSDQSPFDYRNRENEKPPVADNFPPGHYYPRKHGDIRNDQRPETFLDKALDELNENAWRENEMENNQPKEQTDENYDDNYDDEEERLMGSRQLNEIRLQRSEKNTGRYINNDTNDVKNELDPSMDYTNGQMKQNNYFSYKTSNRSSNLDSDYMNIPDVDFVDNIKDAEALGARRKRKVVLPGDLLRRKNLQKLLVKPTQSSFRRIAKNRKKKIQLEEESMHNRNKRHIVRTRLKRVKELDESLLLPEIPKGMQRQPPTGIILPSLKKELGKRTIDLVFSTYWLPSSLEPLVLLPQDLKCMENAEKKIDRNLSVEEKEAVMIECLQSRGVNYQSYIELMEKDNSKVSVGQMTLYRMSLQCSCPEDMLPSQTCKDISQQQSWPQFLGSSASGYFQPLRT